VLVALGAGIARKSAAERAARAGLQPKTFVHSSVIMGERVEIGEGSLIMPGTILTCDVRVGQFVLVNCSCNVGHDVEIESYSTLLGNNALNGNVRVGELATIGSRATILPGKRVGHRSTVGIGSVVIRSVRDDTTVFGSPARILRAAA
jgi:sugar O-acyltransferase (sialic acid O-acetyltransferase NeuD family)